jgi:C1A family cysteine protease
MPIKRILNIVPSKDQHKDWEIDHAIKAGYLKARKTLPASVDLRDSWWKIANQGSSGSCVGWATADGVLRWHFVKNKKLKPAEQLSVRFIWMSAKETDDYHNRPTSFIEQAGTSLKSALDIARNYGCTLAKDLPYDSGKLYQGTEDELYAKASQFKISSYYNLIKKQTDRLATWRQWLGFGGGPILACLDVDNAFSQAAATKGHLETYDKKNLGRAHAVAIVGYTQDYFIIRNSYGKEWGDKGFAYASNAYAKAAFSEAYGIAL